MRYVRQLPVPAVLPAQQAVHPGVQRRDGLGQGPARPAVSGVQELLRRRPGLGARLRAGHRWARATSTGASLGGTKKFTFNAELLHAVPGRRQRPHPAHVRLRRRRQRVRRGTTDVQWDRKKLRASAGVGISWIRRSGPLRLAFAIPIGAKEDFANWRSKIESSACNSRSEPPSDEALLRVAGALLVPAGPALAAQPRRPRRFRVGFVNTDRIFREASRPRPRRPSSSRNSSSARRN